MYALVKEGAIIQEFGSVPDSLENVSGFDTLTDVERAVFGFVVLTLSDAVLNDGQKFGATIITVNPDGSVTKSRKAVSMNADEKAAALLEAQNTAISAINGNAHIALSALVSSYPPLEVSTWPNQYAEALAYSANSSASTPTLSAISSASGIALADVVNKVLSKAAAYSSVAGAIVGKRQALTASVIKSTTPSGASAIGW